MTFSKNSLIASFVPPSTFPICQIRLFVRSHPKFIKIKSKRWYHHQKYSFVWRHLMKLLVSIFPSPTTFISPSMSSTFLYQEILSVTFSENSDLFLTNSIISETHETEPTENISFCFYAFRKWSFTIIPQQASEFSYIFPRATQLPDIVE